MFPKPVCIKLHGEEKKALRKAIFDRSKGKCVVCGRPAQEWHHEKLLPGLRSDTIHEGVALCQSCHDIRTNHDWDGEMRRVIIDYLKGLYPDIWRDK